MKNYRELHYAKNCMLSLTTLLLACALFSAECIAQEKPNAAVERDSVIVAAREIMGMQKYCALVTIDSAGIPHIRTMNPFAPEEDMTVWMATNSRSDKVQHILKNPRVCLYYANHAEATGYVAITGKAVLVNDKDEISKRKRAYWTKAFPDWQYLLLIKVIPEKMEVINYRHGLINGSVTWNVPTVEFKKP
jgi:general stress protein 26